MYKDIVRLGCFLTGMAVCLGILLFPGCSQKITLKAPVIMTLSYAERNINSNADQETLEEIVTFFEDTLR